MPFPEGAPPAAGVVTGHRELLTWQSGAPCLVATVEQYAERAITTPHGILVFGPRTAVLVRPGGEQVRLAGVPDSAIALSADGRLAALAGVDFPSDVTTRPRFVLYRADLADGTVRGTECLAMPSIDALRDGVVYYRVRTGDQGKRAAMAWEPGQEPVPGLPPGAPGPRVSAALAAGDPYVVTGTEGTPLTEIGLGFGARLAPGGRWLYTFSRPPAAGGGGAPGISGAHGSPGSPVVLSLAEVSGDDIGAPRTWPLPSGCATAWGGNRRPTWEDDNHLLLVTPHETIPGPPGTRAIRIDVTSGAIERVIARRPDGSPSDIEVFVEPFLASRPLPARRYLLARHYRATVTEPALPIAKEQVAYLCAHGNLKARESRSP
jgi:hypothetical protein